ncbi:MAG: tail fiber domain-containing protein, partial [Bacteroidetes bacterium]|nr:tail fiber domain-containing protein [Bacteroidota bacterium]
MKTNKTSLIARNKRPLCLMPCALYLFFTIHYSLFTFHSFSQGVAINTNGAAANNSAMLDVSSTNQGVRIPRIALISTTSASPISNPVNSLLVYDTVAVNDVTSGYYYWDTTATPYQWRKLLTSGSSWQLNGNIGTNSGTNFIGTIDNYSLGFRTNNIRRMIIDSLGNVGIGTISPNWKLTALETDNLTAGNHLVEFIANQSKTAGVAHGWYADGNVVTGGLSRAINGKPYFLGTNNSPQAITILDNGNVGIGTTTPNAKLNIAAVTAGTPTINVDGNSSYSTLHLVTIGRSSSGYGTIGDGFRTTSTANKYNYDRPDYATQIDFVSGNISFKTSPIGIVGNEINFTNAMTILNNGNVGIGMSTPNIRLEVMGANNVRSGEFIRVTGNVNGALDNSAGLGIDESGSYWGTSLFSNSTRLFTVESNGGILVGSGYQTNNAPSNGAIIQGNVGIGTTAPSEKLEVCGNLKVIGTIRASSTITASQSITCSSDIRFKKDITPLSGALDNILKLQGVTYYWKAKDFPDKNFTDDKQIGLIAQELEKVYPELVVT